MADWSIVGLKESGRGGDVCVLVLQTVCDSSVCVVKKRSQGKGSSFIDNKCLKWKARARALDCSISAGLILRGATLQLLVAGSANGGRRKEGGLGRK